MWQTEITKAVTTRHPRLTATGHRVLDKLITSFRSPDPEENDYNANYGIYFEELATKILAQGPAGLNFLLTELKRSNFARQRGILAALGRAEPPLSQLREVFLRYLKDQRELIVAEAIDGLTHLRDTTVASQVLPCLSHASPYVRGSVLRYLSRLYGAAAKESLITCLSDPHYIVRENAVDELADLGITEAIPKIQPLLQDTYQEVRMAAKTALETLQDL